MFVKPFKKLSIKDAGIAGGKGASLGEMTQVGIPVPGGFVILSSAFDFFKHSDLNAKLNAILKRLDYKDLQSVEEASKAIKKDNTAN